MTRNFGVNLNLMGQEVVRSQHPHEKVELAIFICYQTKRNKSNSKKKHIFGARTKMQLNETSFLAALKWHFFELEVGKNTCLGFKKHPTHRLLERTWKRDLFFCLISHLAKILTGSKKQKFHNNTITKN